MTMVLNTPAGNRARPRPQPAPRPTLVHARILLVEDEPVTLEVFSMALRKEGHHVTAARDGLQALRMLRDEHPNLIVLDLGLPNVPGCEVLRRLRAETGATTPVLVVSASHPTEHAVTDELLQPGRWLCKPLRPRELVAVVREFLADQFNP